MSTNNENLDAPPEALNCSSTWSRESLNKHYKDLKREIETDVRQLNEETKLSSLETSRLTLERKLQENLKTNEELSQKILDEEKRLEMEELKLKDLQEEMTVYRKIEDQTDPE